MRLPALLTLAALLVAGPLAAAAADPTAADSTAVRRPRIGLALGGGGARGGAHIGVLKVLEQMHVPIDFVAGTSMGSIVGALYAIGLTPEQIESEMTAVDWDDLFSDTPLRQERSFRRKQDDSAYFLPVEFGLTRRGFIVAPGVIAGQKLSFAFPNPELYLAGHDSFDDLAYPYRPVATDLATGEMVVLDHGNLLRAVRASMSIPGVFPPVEWDGRHLVDGYLARNLPVDVVRAMGADIVIAVDVGALPDSTDVTRLSTMSEIGQQTALIQSRQNVDPQVALADVVIRPDMPGITTRDFKLTTATIPLGEAAARGVADQLAALAVDPDAYARHVAAHRMPAPGGVTIERIEVKADAHTSAEAIRHRIRQPLGQYFYLEDLKEDLVHLYDRGVYELVDFSLARVAPGSNGAVLTVTAKRKVYAPHIVHFGLSYEAGETGRSAVNLRMRVSSLELNSRGAELRNDLQLGRADYLSSEYYQPLTMSRVPFVALRGRAGGQLRPWYYDFRRWGEYLEKEYSAGADLGLRLGVAGEIRGGVNYGHLSTEDRTGLSLAEFDGAYGGWVGRIAFDMMDSPVFPSHGFEGWFRVFRCDPAFGSGLDYTQAQGVFRTVTTAGRNTYGITFQGGSSLGTTLPEHAMFTLGGIGRLTAYASDVFRGESYGHAALMWYRHIGGGLSPYSTKWYVGASVEAGNAWREAREAGLDDLRGCASAFIGANTMLGPLLVTYGRAGDGHDAYYVTLGRVFSLLD